MSACFVGRKGFESLRGVFVDILAANSCAYLVQRCDKEKIHGNLREWVGYDHFMICFSRGDQ